MINATFHVTDMHSDRDLFVTVEAEDSAAGMREARWLAFAMAAAMGVAADYTTLLYAEI